MAMAKNQISQVNFSLSKTQLLALNLGLLALAPMVPAQAQVRKAPVYNRQVKDFKHPKRLIVPTSEIQRRIDYQAFGTRDSLMLPTYIPKYPPSANLYNATGNATGSGNSQLSNSDPSLPPPNTAAGNLYSSNKFRDRQGLTPPPPPAKTSLLPQSLTQNQPAINKQELSLPTAALHSANLSAEQIAKIRSESQHLIQRGHLLEAQELLQRYCQEYPFNNELSHELAKVSLNRAKFHQTKKEFEASATQARIAIAYGGNSSISTQAQQYLQENLTKLGINPKDSTQRAKLASQLAGKGSALQAEVEFLETARLNPSFSPYLEAGDQALKAHRLPQAKEHYLKALELNPDSQITLRQLGITRYYLNDHVGANADLTRALVLNTQDTVAAATLFQLWQQQVQAHPHDANSHLGLARAYQIAGNLPAAQSEYLKVVAINPQHPNLPAARQSFKLAYARQEAQRAFQESQTLANQGSLQAAYQKAHEAVQFCPSDSRYLNQKTSLGEKLTQAGLPLTLSGSQAQNPVAGSQNLIAEAPPLASIPTAASLGLTPANSATGGGTALFAAENMYRPLGSDQHVATIAGFLSDVRNTALAQRNQIKATEKTTQSILSTLGIPGKENIQLASPPPTLAGLNLADAALNSGNSLKELTAPQALALPQVPASEIPGQASTAEKLENLTPSTPVASAQVPGTLTPAIASTQEAFPMRLLLTGVRSSRNEVFLKVVLSNSSAKTITLPAKLQAIVKDKNLTEKMAKTNFSNRKLAAGDSITGTIQVPGKALDPRADIFLDLKADSSHGILSPTAVHLSLPIAQKP